MTAHAPFRPLLKSLWLTGAALLGATLAAPPGAAQTASPATMPLRPDQADFRDLYRELVETDTSITTGSCTALADKV
ncbi:hypothetical protein ABTL59_19780, partial [Acinetobacter baumannii]